MRNTLPKIPYPHYVAVEESVYSSSGQRSKPSPIPNPTPQTKSVIQAMLELRKSLS